jgi:hypothetical protein
MKVKVLTDGEDELMDRILAAIEEVAEAEGAELVKLKGGKNADELAE